MIDYRSQDKETPRECVLYQKINKPISSYFLLILVVSDPSGLKPPAHRAHRQISK
jgi:hypothetical protein